MYGWIHCIWKTTMAVYRGWRFELGLGSSKSCTHPSRVSCQFSPSKQFLIDTWFFQTHSWAFLHLLTLDPFHSPHHMFTCLDFGLFILFSTFVSLLMCHTLSFTFPWELTFEIKKNNQRVTCWITIVVNLSIIADWEENLLFWVLDIFLAFSIFLVVILGGDEIPTEVLVKPLSHLDDLASVWQRIKIYLKRWRTLNYWCFFSVLGV